MRLITDRANSRKKGNKTMLEQEYQLQLKVKNNWQINLKNHYKKDKTYK